MKLDKKEKSKQRKLLLENLALKINSFKLDHPIRVAIDGVDTSGKTTLANELAEILGKFGRMVVRSSIDGFHNPREERYRRGKDSPEGYYLDSFHHEALIKELLEPFGPKGDRFYRKAIFDFRTDSNIKGKPQLCQNDTILLFDGVFLLRPELFSYWDLKIFLKVPFKEVIKRAKIRDIELFGNSTSVEARYKQRYIPGQQIYLRTVKPEQLADIVIDNSDFNKPLFSKKPS